MKPLPFAIGVLASDHLSKRCTATVAILWFLAIIVEIFLLVGRAELAGIQFHLLALQDLLLGFLLVLVLELGSQHLLVLLHFAVKLIRDFFLLLRVAEELLLLAGYDLVVGL
jgi:hypothetical protein